MTGQDQAATAAVGPVTGLTVLYDDRCGFCNRCASWLARQPVRVPLRLVPAAGDEAEARYAHLPLRGQELVVVADDGRFWIGPAAFVMTLWATHRHRGFAARCAEPALAPYARRALEVLSANRGRLSTAPGADCDEWCPPAAGPWR